MIQPSSPDGVAAAVAELILRVEGRCRVVVDGAPAADPAGLADTVVEALAPRPAAHVRADGYWRPASLRLEHGRENPESWLTGWLDDAALERELLEPFAHTGRVIEALRDPLRDRSLRVEPVHLPGDAVLIVSGSVLLGRALPFDRAVHIHLTPSALARRTPLDERWILEAIATYETTAEPDVVADLVIRSDDPRHPAIVGS